MLHIYASALQQPLTDEVLAAAFRKTLTEGGLNLGSIYISQSAEHLEVVGIVWTMSSHAVNITSQIALLHTSSGITSIAHNLLNAIAGLDHR